MSGEVIFRWGIGVKVREAGVRYLSLFSGIEAATVAWKPLGWECSGVAEIEKFPSLALSHHYPDVQNLGDVTKVTEEQIAALGHIDLIVGGFPCQDVSVAGKRKGFEHEGERTRSGLFYEAMRIVDIAKRRNGCRFLLLENVPGIFSSRKGEDFRTVVNEILGTDFPIPKNKWQKTGVAFGPNGLLEWATLDAQYFGLAQRRKRMFALADFGDWASRPALLLEPQSVCGDTPPSRKTGEEIAPTIRSGAPNGGAGHGDRSGDSKDELIVPVGYRYQNEKAGIVEDAVSATLRRESGTTDERSVPAYVVWPADVTPTLDASYGDKWGLEDQHINAGGGLFVNSPLPDREQPENRCGNRDADSVSRGFL